MILHELSCNYIYMYIFSFLLYFLSFSLSLNFSLPFSFFWYQTHFLQNQHKEVKINKAFIIYSKPYSTLVFFFYIIDILLY